MIDLVLVLERHGDNWSRLAEAATSECEKAYMIGKSEGYNEAKALLEESLIEKKAESLKDS